MDAAPSAEWRVAQGRVDHHRDEIVRMRDAGDSGMRAYSDPSPVVRIPKKAISICSSTPTALFRCSTSMASTTN